MENALNAVMAPAPTPRDGRLLRKRYAKVRESIITFLSHAEMTTDDNGGKRGFFLTDTNGHRTPDRRPSPMAVARYSSLMFAARIRAP